MRSHRRPCFKTYLPKQPRNPPFEPSLKAAPTPNEPSWPRGGGGVIHALCAHRTRRGGGGGGGGRCGKLRRSREPTHAGGRMVSVGGDGGGMVSPIVRELVCVNIEAYHPTIHPPMVRDLVRVNIQAYQPPPPAPLPTDAYNPPTPSHAA